jgi:lipopolysaccharide export system protein LptC
VQRLKLWLPIAAGLGIAGFVAATALSGIAPPEGVTVKVDDLALSDGKVVMANPRLSGFTSDNRAYEMTADRAIQDSNNAKYVELEGILAKFPMENGAIATVRAKSGNYDDTSKTLELTDPFSIRTDDGMAADLQSATINVETGTLSTKDAVDININGTTVRADTLAITDSGKVLVFENRVKMIIEPNKLQTADTNADTGQTGN